MTGVQKIALAIVAVGGVTSVLLPGRQTPQVLKGIKELFQGSLFTAMTGKLK